MLEAFQEWVRQNSERLKDLGVSITTYGPSQRPDRNSFAVDLDAGRYQANVQLWDTGECDIVLGDFELAANEPDKEAAEVSTYVFKSPEEFLSTLELLLNRMVSKPDSGGCNRGPVAQASLPVRPPPHASG